MTIIVFLLDTSASMNQRVFLGGRPTLLDVAKSAVETFVKVRQRSMESRQDRYMLLTFEDPPSNIKAGWKENLVTFMHELKNLQANGLTTLGNALRHTFDVLNVNRMQHGIDTYGQGRSPFYLEPSIIVAITDGGKLSSNSGVQDELKIHGSSPGCELTREPFRWDQRLFSLVLRMSGQPLNDRETGLVPSDNSPIDAMCEVTGGRSYCITSHRMLLQCIDSLVQKVQAGVVIHFERMGPEPMPLLNHTEKDEDDADRSDSKMAWHNCHKMIYVPRNQKGFAGGFWPIPESFWPDPSMPALPPRTAHPHVKFTCVAQEPLVVENFPFDKYELEPSPLTQYILARKQPSICWQAFVQGSSKNNMLQPFGYLKASSNLSCVNLFVMPYNYPVLLPLLDELFRVYRLRPNNDWRQQFGMYLANMPGYYAGPLKRALIKMNAVAIAQTIPEETYLSYSVLTYLKKLKTQAKMEYERTCNDVGIRVKQNEIRKSSTTSYKNPFDVPRHQLLEHLSKLKSHFLRPTPFSDLNQDNLHSLPVSQMGNYQEYLKRQPTPLREIESAPVRQHMFGNPFKVDKRMIIDETDIDLLGPNGKPSKKQALAEMQQNQIVQQSAGASPAILRERKRKRGPLPLDYNFVPKKARKATSQEPSPTEDRMFEDLGLADVGYDSDSYSTDSSEPPSPLPAPEFKSSYLSNNLALWTDEDFRDTDDDRSEELPDVGNESPDAVVEDAVIHIPEPNEPAVVNGTSPSSSKPPDLLIKVNGSEPVILPTPEPEQLAAPVIKIEPVPTYSTKINGNDSCASGSTQAKIPSEKGKEVKPVKKKAHGEGTTNDTKSSITDKSPSSGTKAPSIPVTNSETNHLKSSKKKTESDSLKSQSKKIKKEKKTSKENIATEPPINEEKVRQINFELRVELFKEIRRPRFRMDYFLTKLTEIAGPQKMRIEFLKLLETEALRFKRKRVAEMLAQQITG